MKELNQLRSLALETADQVAEWSNVVAPGVAYAAPIPERSAETVLI